jgi:hypothetical protein
MPATNEPRYVHKDVINVLLDKICTMREDLLTVERALERLQAAESLELANHRDGPRGKRSLGNTA